MTCISMDYVIQVLAKVYGVERFYFVNRYHVYEMYWMSCNWVWITSVLLRNRDCNPIESNVVAVGIINLVSVGHLGLIAKYQILGLCYGWPNRSLMNIWLICKEKSGFTNKLTYCVETTMVSSLFIIYSKFILVIRFDVSTLLLYGGVEVI